MKLNDNTNVQMPLKTVVSLITLVSVGTWAYFGVIARLTQVETEYCKYKFFKKPSVKTSRRRRKIKR